MSKKTLMVDTLMLDASDFKPVKLTEEEAGQYSAHWTAPIWNIGKLNLNGRVYTQDLADRICRENKATGVCDGHDPDYHFEYSNYVAVAKTPRIENGQLVVDLYFVDDEYAGKLEKLRAMGVEIGVSSVGYGEQDADGVVNPITYELIRYCDFVQYPANSTYASPAGDKPASQGSAGQDENKETDSQGPAMATAGKSSEEKHMEEKKKEGMASTEQAMDEQKRNLDDEQKKNAAGASGIVDGEKKPAQTMSESKKFVNRIIEAVTVGTSFAGTVPTEIASEIVKKRNTLAQIRGIATVHQASGDYKIAVESTGVTVAYTGEGAAIGDSTPDVSVLTLSAYKIAALVKASRESLTDPAVDVQQYLVDSIGKAMAEFEENEFLNGTGSSNNHITGILTTLALTANKAQVITAASATALTWDDVSQIDAVLSAYAPNATLVMNPATANAIRLLKDGGGHFIFPQNEPLSMVLGHRVLESKFMPKIATGASVIVAGDFSYYHIADRQGLDVQVLNELYAANDQVGIKAVERLDGNCALPEAFCVVKMA